MGLRASPAHPPQHDQRRDGHGQVQRQVAVVAGVHPVANSEGDLLADDLRALGVGHDAAEPRAVPLLLDVLPAQGWLGEAGQVNPLFLLGVPHLPLVGMTERASGFVTVMS